MSAPVEGFGCRPPRMRWGWLRGRRPEAFRGGSRGQPAGRRGSVARLWGLRLTPGPERFASGPWRRSQALVRAARAAVARGERAAFEVVGGHERSGDGAVAGGRRRCKIEQDGRARLMSCPSRAGR